MGMNHHLAPGALRDACQGRPPGAGTYNRDSLDGVCHGQLRLIAMEIRVPSPV